MKAPALALSKVPRSTFFVGALVGVALGVPLVTLALELLSRTAGIGDPDVPYEHIFELGLIFAGLPAFLTGGGVARLAAHRTAERPEGGAPSLASAAVVAALAMALGGAGLAYLVAVPLGGMPEEPARWAPIGGAGAGAGALTGLAIGLLVGLRQKRHPRPATVDPSAEDPTAAHPADTAPPGGEPT